MHEQNESQPKAFIKILFALFTALLVVVLGYLCIQIYTIFHRTYKTETAIAYTMSDNITLKGVAVFQAVDVPGSGNLGYVVQDGERVSAGTILAEQYTDDSQGAMRERLDRLDRAILLLTKSENSSGSDLSVLTTQTRTALYNLLDQIDTASYGAIQDAAEDFLLAQNKLQISTGQAAGFGEVLASLQAERDGIAAQLNGLILCGAALEGLALQQALVIDMYDVALYGRAFVGHQLRRRGTAALQHGVDLLVGDSRGDALGLEAGDLGQLEFRLQGDGGGGHKTHARALEKRGIAAGAGAHYQRIGVGHGLRGDLLGVEAHYGAEAVEDVVYIGDMRFYDDFHKQIGNSRW